MITLLMLYYINIVRKGKEKISFPHLFGKENNSLQSAAIWSMMDTIQTESRNCSCALTESE